MCNVPCAYVLLCHRFRGFLIGGRLTQILADYIIHMHIPDQAGSRALLVCTFAWPAWREVGSLAGYEMSVVWEWECRVVLEVWCPADVLREIRRYYRHVQAKRSRVGLEARLYGP